MGYMESRTVYHPVKQVTINCISSLVLSLFSSLLKRTKGDGEIMEQRQLKIE
jgi:hypothetical protein